MSAVLILSERLDFLNAVRDDNSENQEGDQSTKASGEVLLPALSELDVHLEQIKRAQQ